MKIGSCLILLGFFYAAVPTDARELTVLCQAVPERAIPAAKGAPVLVMQFEGKPGLFRMEGVPISPNIVMKADSASTLGGARLVAVQPEEASKVCEAGYDVSVIIISNLPAPKSAQKGYVPPVSSMPSAFTIAGLWSQTWGSFWVPQSLPSGHTYQVVDFQVTPYNYASSGAFSHLAVPVLTLSNSNFQSDFDGKGAAIGGGWTGCPAQSIGVEAWAIQNWSEGGGCGSGPTCQAVVYSPDSCSSWDNSQPRRFLVGANIWQQVRYWSCPVGGACPSIEKTVDAAMPGYRTGGAGVAFLHALGDSGSVWSLSFNAVTSYTGY